jgi:hypothetical protein
MLIMAHWLGWVRLGGPGRPDLAGRRARVQRKDFGGRRGQRLADVAGVLGALASVAGIVLAFFG